MGIRTRLARLSGTSALLAVAVYVVPVQAQTAAPAAADAGQQPDSRDDIIVTAQKRPENVQQVPIAITALTGANLAAAKIEDSKDLQFNAPNVLLSANRNITIRGVGSQSYGGTNDTNIGVLVNGVFLQSGSTFGDFFDMERIEVLRGPQGTLFGRNTTGGVVNLITHKPTDKFEGFADLQVENYSGIDANAAINIPITGALQQRFAGNFIRRDGYTRNLYDGARIDGRNQYSLRSSTHWEPTSSTRADLVLTYFNEDSTRQNSVKSLCTPNPSFGCGPDSVSTAFPTSNFLIDSVFLPGVVRAGTYSPNPTNLREVRIDVNPITRAKDFLATLEINQDIGRITVTSVTGFRDGSTSSLRDFDQGVRPNAFNPGTFGTRVVPDNGSGNGVLTYLLSGQTISTTDYRTSQTTTSYARQFSQELRLATHLPSMINFVIGGYYLNSRSGGNVTTWVPANTTRGFIASGDTPRGAVRSYAAFGEVYVDITDSLKLLGGVRYTSDNKEIRTASGTFVLGPYFNGKAKFSATTGRASITWNPKLGFTDDTNLYFTYSRGFKSGGFNPGNIGTPTFNSEFIDAYEFGAKNTLLDRALRLNMALFRYDYSSLIVGNIVGTLATNVNVPSSRVQGFELESVLTPVRGLRLEATLGLLDTKILSSFLSSDPTRGGAFFQLQGNQLPNAPKRTLKLAAEYTFDLGNDWTVRPRVDFYSQSGFYSREFNLGADRVNSWSQLDMQLQVAKPAKDWSINLFVKNLLDQNSITFLEANSNLVGSFRSAFLLDPRTFGVALHVGF